MKKINSTFISVLLLFGITVFVFSTSCKRNKKCDVSISVVDDTTGYPIPNAIVHLYPDPSNPSNSTMQIQDQTGVTDGSGSVSFTFKLPAILRADIDQTKWGKGSALVKLEEGKQVSKIIKVY